MVEAYKIILRESGSVRRAEELARRMKAKSGQKAKVGTRKDQLRVISEELDKMQEDMQKAFSNKKDEETNNASKVKLIRSRRETKITFTFKGSLEETEDRLQKVFKAVTK
jgi:N-methylhydantoinase B/oxoprolinase/acetone carboxylase alpha subunit